MKKYSLPPSSPDNLRKKFKLFLTLPAAQKLKMRRTICAETLASLSKGDHSLEDLNLYEAILREVAKSLNVPDGCKTGLSKIAALRLQIMGISGPKTILKKNIELPTDIAAFVVRDLSLSKFSLAEIQSQRIAHMNNGEFFIFPLLLMLGLTFSCA